jgi:voltage-gated potassium channel
MLKLAFSDPHSGVFRVWNKLIALLIFVSCIVLALDSIPEVAKDYEHSFSVIEWFSVAIFTIDYFGHIAFSEKKWRYAFTMWGIIDLLSILPSYLMLLNLTALQGSKVLRLLRVARVLRVLKLARMMTANGKSTNPVLDNLKIYFIVLFSVLMISSTAMFFVEGELYSPEVMVAGQQALDQKAAPGAEPEKFMPTDPITGNAIPEDKRFFTSIPTAMWWCIVTLTTTGYGDMFPVTVGGRLVAAVTMLLGLVLFGILLNVIGNTLMLVLFGEKTKE